MVCLCAAAVAVSVGAALCAQQPQAPAAPGAAVKATAEDVLLDIVVRDKKGHEVKDLKPDDLQIIDNGEPKQIKSFRLIDGNEAVRAGGAPTPLEPLHQVRLVTMIFQFRSNSGPLAQEAVGASTGSTLTAPSGSPSSSAASDADARRLCRDGARDFLKQGLPPNVYVAVMAIDHQLEVLQPYTNDPDLLRKAIDRATKLQVRDFGADTERVRKELEQAVASPPSGQSAGPDAAAKMVMDRMLLQVLNTEQTNAMMESGRVEIFSLLDAVKEQYRVPGRKTVLYFSEGFTIPQGLEYAFDGLIGVANRSNVSFYIVDAHGLRTSSANQDAVSTLRSAAQTDQQQAGKLGSEPVTMAEVRLMDTVLESTRANYQLTLAHLADSTGGFLVANTNDLRGPTRKLAEDIQTYYELSYSPEIRNYDGSFHKIVVKTASDNLRVQSRSGYNALAPSESPVGIVAQPYEAPLLAALTSPELPKAFDYETAAMHFRGLRNESVADVVLDVPLANVTFEKSDADHIKGRLSYVILLKDEQGAVVKKFQNDIPLTEPASRLEEFKTTHFIYAVHFDLPPGHYTLETAVQDGEGNRISARKTSVTMPKPSGLSISSACVVRSTKEREASTDDADPMLLGTKVVSPTLNPVIQKANTNTLPFYFVIYTDKSVAATPQLIMEFSRNGKVLGAGMPPLTPPDKDGRIPYVAMTPLDRFEPGDFTVKFIVKQGSETAVETAEFKLQ
jgi:VWFA-related protein